MKTRSTILAALLIVQLVIAGGLLYASHSKKVTRPEGMLLAFDPAAINKVEIASGGDEGSVVLSKNGDNWQLPDNRNVAADSTKMQALVTALSELQTGWAVATKATSHAQLEVAEADHQRRVKLYEGEQLVGDLYIGTSPGMRRVHARKVDTDEVYSVALNSHDTPVAVSDWLQKDLLAAKAITAVNIDDATLAQQDDTWQITTDGETVAADDGKVNALSGAIERLRVQDVATEIPADAKPVTIVVTAESGELTYQLMEAGEDYYASRSDIDAAFKIQKSDYEAIANVTADELKAEVVEGKPAEPAQSGEAPAAGSEAEVKE